MRAARTRTSTGRKTNSSFDLDAVKAIPIKSVATDLGFVLNARGHGRCRLPGHDDKIPSFAILDRSNAFKCYACGRGGSDVDLVMEMLGLSFVEACKWLQERFLGPSPVQPVNRPTIRPAITDTPTRRNDVRPDPQIYEWLLRASPLQDSGRRYLRARCIPEKTIAKFEVGQLADATSILARAIREWGGERMSTSGLLAETRYGQRLVFPTGYLLFPFRTGSTISYLQSRSISAAKTRRWFCPLQLLPPIYNRNAIASKSRTIAICEGITDVLSADALKITAIGVLGAHGAIDDQAIAALSGRNIEIIADNDKSGEQFSKRIVRALKSRGTTVVIKEIPSSCNDLNDYLVAKRGTKR